MNKLILYPDKRLFEKSETIANVDSDVKKIAVLLNRLMKEVNGFGLSAPQIGYGIRLAVVKNKIEGPGLVLINPAVLHTEGKITDMEGCLSIPGIYGEVTRPQSVLLEAGDLTGMVSTHRFEGEQARAVMHEIDHLNGKLFWDALPAESREKLMEEYLDPNQS